MPWLNKAQIIAARDTQIERVPTPEWGEGSWVYIRVMTGREFDYFNTQLSSGTLGNLRSLVCSLALCDEQGGRLFTTDEVDALAEKNALVLDRIYEAVCRVNLLRDIDRDAARKNESPDLTDASGLSLPVSLEGEASENGRA